MKKRLFAALALCAPPLFAAHTTVTTAPRLPFLRGMNFRGYYESVTDAYADKPSTYSNLKSKGFDHVRLPVDLRQRANYSNGTATFKSNMSTIDTAIDCAEAAGLYIILDFHGWFNIDPADAASTNQFIAIWKAAAERYQNRSNKLIFELANEPNTKSYGTLCTMQKNAIKEIRKTNPTRLILFDPGDASQPWVLTGGSNFSWVSLPANDNNIAVVVHCYNPGEFTHQGAWGHSSTQVRLTDSHRTTLNWDLSQCKAWLDGTGVPIVMDEFGAAHRVAVHDDVTEYDSIVTRWCEANGVPWAPWLYCQNSEFDCFNSNGTMIDYVEAGLFPDLTTTDKFAAADYAHSIDISFCGYAGASPLADFPVLVKLSERLAGFRYADFQRPGGFDLAFTDSSGNLIPHEIDTWNTNGLSTVWVKVPSLTAATAITAHYGCAKPIVPKVESVWDENYVGVWHLGETALPLADSSNVSRDFTAADGMGIGYAAAGVAGGAVDFGPSGNGRGLFAADHAALDGFAAFTIEAWTFQTNRAQNAGILSKRVRYGSEVSYYLYDSGSSETLQVSSDGVNATSLGLSPTPELGRWNHQAFTYDSTAAADNARAYLGGALARTATAGAGAVTNAAGELCLGNLHSGNAANFPGKIDEVRISKTVRSADWIQATHDTIALRSFAAYAVDGVASPDGPEEPETPAQPVVATDAAGYGWTNRVVSVSGLPAGMAATLALARAGDAAPASQTATADASGTAIFDVPTTPGALYAYTVSTNGAEAASGSFHAGGWDADGGWFLAVPDGAGGAVESNGAWTVAPAATNATHFVAGDTSVFALSAAAREEGASRLFRADSAVVYPVIADFSALSTIDIGDMLAAVAPVNDPDGGRAAWAASFGAGWRILDGGPTPVVDAPCVVRLEGDFSEAASPGESGAGGALPRVRLSVSADGGATFLALSDRATGAEWFPVAAVEKTGLSEIGAQGPLQIASLGGSLANAAVAEAGGVRYDSLAEALAAGDVTLLTNAEWPADAPAGTIAVDPDGHTLLKGGVAVAGGSVVVDSGPVAIAGEGTVRVTFATLASVGVATAGLTPAELAAALAETGANGIPKWQSYVLGLDTADPAALPVADIAMVDDGVVAVSDRGIAVDEDAGVTVTYQVYEIPDLAHPDVDTPVGDAAVPGTPVELPMGDAASRFFRIKVEITLP